jgi:hypothetical protein
MFLKLKSSVITIVYFLKLFISEATIISEEADFSLKFKSVKCTVDEPEVMKMNFCYIKPISRAVSSLNLGAELFEEFASPTEVENNI